MTTIWYIDLDTPTLQLQPFNDMYCIYYAYCLQQPTKF